LIEIAPPQRATSNSDIMFAIKKLHQLFSNNTKENQYNINLVPPAAATSKSPPPIPSDVRAAARLILSQPNLGALAQSTGNSNIDNRSKSINNSNSARPGSPGVSESHMEKELNLAFRKASSTKNKPKSTSKVTGHGAGNTTDSKSIGSKRKRVNVAHKKIKEVPLDDEDDDKVIEDLLADEENEQDMDDEDEELQKPHKKRGKFFIQTMKNS